MQHINNTNNLFTPENLKYIEINNFATNVYQKNFVNGIHNARIMISDLERSLYKSSKYEKKLLRCKASHAHLHEVCARWDSEGSDVNEFKCSKTDADKSSKSQVDLVESWSTMSIVCLQYQYEELSKRYECLLQAYNERCESATAINLSASRLRQNLKLTHAQLARAHGALLTVGDKYLALRRRSNAQKSRFEEKIDSLKQNMREVVETAERARLEFDAQLSHCLAEERDSETAMLLIEIRKCNILYLENLLLKAQIEELAPDSINSRSEK